jgi:hypothetical protein
MVRLLIKISDGCVIDANQIEEIILFLKNNSISVRMINGIAHNLIPYEDESIYKALADLIVAINKESGIV